jgi:uncharacterized membrane protein
MVRSVEQLLFWCHGLSAAAWFGAIFYRTFIIDPKSFRYFEDRADYERFNTFLVHGMRYVVIAGLLTCGLSGFVLAGMRWDSTRDVWVGLMIAKLVVWVLASALFTYVSWVHWVYRSVAAPHEYRYYRREGIVLAVGMVLLCGTGFALGQACRLA